MCVCVTVVSKGGPTHACVYATQTSATQPSDAESTVDKHMLFGPIMSSTNENLNNDFS